MKKSIWLTSLLLLSPYLMLCFFYAFYPSKPLVWSPSNSKYTVYTDKEMGGNSTATISNQGDTLKFDYRLAEGVQYPYAGFHMSSDVGVPLSDYNELVFQFESSAPREVPISLVMENHTWEDGRDLDLMLEYNIHQTNGRSLSRVGLKDLRFPKWWVIKNDVDPFYEFELEHETLNSINFNSRTYAPLSEEDSYHIGPLVFRQNIDKPTFIAGLVILGLELLVVLIVLMRKKYRIKIVPVQYAPKEVEPIVDEHHSKILAFIRENYVEIVTADVIQKETGISTRKVVSVIKEKYGLTLKQLVTQIRIEEAKRLLSETDLPVGEICVIVGFGNTSHFNRVFKTETKVTPLQHRKGEM